MKSIFPGSRTATSDPDAEPVESGKKKLTKEQKKARRKKIIILSIAGFLILAGGGLVAGTYWADSLPEPEELPLPEATTVYYADNKTPMAKLGEENRTILKQGEINDAVLEAIVAAEDQTFWTNEGIDFKGVLRAAWNNVTGGATQGASTITQQYARNIADLTGVTYSRKLREAVIAYKLTQNKTKEEILNSYLNTVPFGRGAYGIEAAADVYMGKTANRNAPKANQLTLEEAMVLVAMVKQPYPDPDDPEGHPGYDPTLGPIALENSKGRWTYVRSGLVKTGALTQAEANALKYPDGAVKEYNMAAYQSGMNLPTGVVVNHILSELRQLPQFKGKGTNYIENGGFRIITTLDPGAQKAAEEAANIRQTKAPSIVQGQPKNWQAALVSVEPGTGRVLAFYGGPSGTGADYAGWYYDSDGDPRGFGEHPPGSTFKVYDLMEALRQGISLDSVWDSPPSKEFPEWNRTKKTKAGPVSNASRADCQPNCTLTQATVASLNVPFFDLTTTLGYDKVMEMAAKAGIDDMWANVEGKPLPVRVPMTGDFKELSKQFSPEVGIGQYGVTVVDHANGMATVAAGGKRAKAHFVREVTKGEDKIYTEDVATTDVGLTEDQINQLNATLQQVTAAKLDNGWDSGGKTGTWQVGSISQNQNAHVWMVGYTRAIAAAVWIGTDDGKALKSKSDGYAVYGSNYAGPIWRQYMEAATKAMNPDESKAKFTSPQPTATPTPDVTPTDTPGPTDTGTPGPTDTGGPGPTETDGPAPTTPPVTPSLPAATLPNTPLAPVARPRS